MTDHTKQSGWRSVTAALPDIVGIAGLALLTRGLWLWFGEPAALSVCGALLICLSIASVTRGGR